MYDYTEKAKIVKPRKIQVQIMEGKLNIAKSDLKKAK